MDDKRFDDLLKGLAGGFAGAVGLALGRTVAWAAPNRCAVFCTQFFPKGPAGAACRQACRECDADLSRLCIGPTGAACCAPEAECCIDVTGREHCVECPEGTFLSFETCECEPFVECLDGCFDNVCGVAPLAVCDENPETGPCLCAATLTETCACVQPICGDVCDPEAPDCPEGFACIHEECCGFPTCVALCQTPLGADASTAQRWS
jgi:hypothetical protein